MNNEQKKILVVDDEESIGWSLEELFTDAGYCTRYAASFREAIELLKEEIFDLIVTDIKLGDGNGIDILKQGKKLQPSMGMIVMTAYGSLSTALKSIKLGVNDYIIKPFDVDDMKRSVRAVFKERSLIQGDGMRFKRTFPSLREVPGPDARLDIHSFESEPQHRVLFHVFESGPGVAAVLFAEYGREYGEDFASLLTAAMMAQDDCSAGLGQRVERGVGVLNRFGMAGGLKSLFYGHIETANGRFNYIHTGNNQHSVYRSVEERLCVLSAYGNDAAGCDWVVGPDDFLVLLESNSRIDPNAFITGGIAANGSGWDGRSFCDLIAADGDGEGLVNCGFAAVVGHGSKLTISPGPKIAVKDDLEFVSGGVIGANY
jgi:ActR/RegA family two-component response regulator